MRNATCATVAATGGVRQGQADHHPAAEVHRLAVTTSFVPGVGTRAVRSLALGIGIGALAFGPGAGVAGAAAPSAKSQAVPGEVVLSNGRTLSRWAYPQTGRDRAQDPLARGARRRAAALPDRGRPGRGLPGAEEGAGGADRRDVDEGGAGQAPQPRQRLGRGERARNAAHRPRPARGAPLEAASDAVQRSGTRDLERPGRRRPSVAARRRPVTSTCARSCARSAPRCTGPTPWAPARTRRSSPTGPGAAWSASTAPTSPGSSRDGRRTAASACATPTSPGSGT